jgi:hypothetical protein
MGMGVHSCVPFGQLGTCRSARPRAVGVIVIHATMPLAGFVFCPLLQSTVVYKAYEYIMYVGF